MDTHLTSKLEPFSSYEDNYEYHRRPQQKPEPFAARSGARYGSRSIERSLQHPLGFRNPLKSLSPLAIRIAQESDTDSETGGEIEGPNGTDDSTRRNFETAAVNEPHQIQIEQNLFSFSEPVFSNEVLPQGDHVRLQRWWYSRSGQPLTLVQNGQITNVSITDFHCTLVRGLYGWPAKAAILQALSPLLQLFKQFKDGSGMILGEKIQNLKDVAAAFLKTLELAEDTDWVSVTSLSCETPKLERAIPKNQIHALAIKDNVMYALRLIESQIKRRHDFDAVFLDEWENFLVW